MGHRKILSAKQSLCLEKEKGEKSIHAAEIECCLALCDMEFPWPPSQTQDTSPGHTDRGKTKMEVHFQGTAMLRTKNGAPDIPMKNLP